MASVDDFFLYLLGRHATQEEMAALATLPEDQLRSAILQLPAFDSDRHGNGACPDLLHGTTTPPDVILAYRIILARAPESAQVIAAKVASLPRLAHLRAELIQSAEFKALYRASFAGFVSDSLVRDAYLLTLQRQPESEEVVAAHRGKTLHALAHDFLRSPEFVAKHGLVRADLLQERSLLILGYPRGVSSAFYSAMCACLQEALNPSPASDGEILNRERYLYAERPVNSMGFWLAPDEPGHMEACAYVAQLLDAHASGFIVKDVCFPFQVMDYLARPENRDKYRVVVIRREPAEVLAACQRVGWDWVSGDKMAQIDACYSHFHTVDAADFIHGRIDGLLARLRSHYPQARQRDYLSPHFLKKRQAVTGH